MKKKRSSLKLILTGLAFAGCEFFILNSNVSYIDYAGIGDSLLQFINILVLTFSTELNEFHYVAFASLGLFLVNVQSGVTKSLKNHNHFAANVFNDRQAKSRVANQDTHSQADQMDQLLSEMSNIAKIGSWELDLTSNELKWSEVVYEIHEVDKGIEVTLPNAINFYHPDYQDTIEAAVEEGRMTGKPWDLELKIVTGTGKEKWVRAIGKPVLEQGKLVKLQGLFQDIDQQKQVEIDLVKMNQELESFSYSVSHDLRAPLRAINGFAEVLSSDRSDTLDESTVYYLKRILDNGNKMDSLIDDLLRFSRLGNKDLELKEIDSTSIVKSIIENYHIDQKSLIQVDDLPKIIGDGPMVTQVFANLISNAIKYSSKNENPMISITSSQDEDSIYFHIADNGVGFNMDQAERLFQTFQRLHSSKEFEGNGVGLALSKKIMEAHGGSVSAQAKENAGATFTLRFAKA